MRSNSQNLFNVPTNENVDTDEIIRILKAYIDSISNDSSLLTKLN